MPPRMPARACSAGWVIVVAPLVLYMGTQLAQDAFYRDEDKSVHVGNIFWLEREHCSRGHHDAKRKDELSRVT